MNTHEESRPQDSADASQPLPLASQGQNWRFLQETSAFISPQPLFDRPLEITVHMLRGLRMVDETIVVHGDVQINMQTKE